MSRIVREAGFGMRSDLYSMIMPFFPDDQGQKEHIAVLGGYKIKITSDNPDNDIATPSDRKILNLLAGALKSNIQSGLPPSRHLAIDVRTVASTFSEDIGGSQYARIQDRLKRLMSTIIETEMPMGNEISKRRRFRWIDAFETTDHDLPAGRQMLQLKISLSEDAFFLMTRSLGFDISRTHFMSLTSSSFSTWRIYEICLARLITRDGKPTIIGIDDLRKRVPISSELKVFKARPLRSAMQVIAEHPVMSSHIKLELVQSQADGSWEEIDFSTRSKLDKLAIRITKGPEALPPLDRILSETEGGLEMT